MLVLSFVTYVQLMRQHPRTLGFGLINSFFSQMGQTHMMSLFTPFIMAEFALSKSHYGLIYSLATLGGGLCIPFIGPYLDKVDIRKIAALSGLGLVAGLVLLTQSTGPLTLILYLFILRLFGQGLCSQICQISIARYFDKNRGKAIVIAFMGFSLAEGLMTPVISRFLEIHPWRSVALGLAGETFFIYIPLALLLTASIPAFNKFSDFPKKETPLNTTPLGTDLSTEAPSTQWTRTDVLKHSLIYVIFLQALLPPFTLTGIFFYQAAIGELQGWPLSTMALGFTGFAGARFFSSFLGGPSVDKWGAFKLFPWLNWPMLFGFIILGTFTPSWTPFLACLFFGVTVGIGSSVKAALYPELYGVRFLGSIKSAVSMLMVFSTALAPFLFGTLLDRGLTAQQLFYSLFILGTLISLFVTYWFYFGPGQTFYKINLLNKD